MKTTMLWTTALLLTVPLPAFAQAAPPAQAVTIRYKFTPGQTQRYQMTMTMQGLVRTGQSGAGVPVNTSMRMIYRQTVQSVRPSDGAATLVGQIEETHLLSQGKEMQTSDAQKAQMSHTFTTQMLPTGKMLSADLSGLGPSNLPGLDMSKGLFSNVSFLPDGPVKVGDTWRGAGMASIAGMQMGYVATLTGLTQKNGATLASIAQRQTGRVNTTLRRGLPSPMTMVGRVSGTGTQVFDTTTGMPQSTEGTTSTALTMTFSKTGGKAPAAGTPRQMRVQMTATFSMQRLPDAPPLPAAQ